MSKQEDAEKILPELLQIVSSDVMKAAAYLKKAVAVAIVAEDTRKATKIARYQVELDNFSKRLETL